MKRNLSALYSGIIKQNNDTPYHFEKTDQASNTIKAYNPLCGDRFELYLNASENKIGGLHFYGFGCAISKASVSVLTKSLEGKTLVEALQICNNFLGFINQKLAPLETAWSEEFNAFSGVHDFPERRDCATLAWTEMKLFLESCLKSPTFTSPGEQRIQ